MQNLEAKTFPEVRKFFGPKIASAPKPQASAPTKANGTPSANGNGTSLKTNGAGAHSSTPLAAIPARTNGANGRRPNNSGNYNSNSSYSSNHNYNSNGNHRRSNSNNSNNNSSKSKANGNGHSRRNKRNYAPAIIGLGGSAPEALTTTAIEIPAEESDSDFEEFAGGTFLVKDADGNLVEYSFDDEDD